MYKKKIMLALKFWIAFLCTLSQLSGWIHPGKFPVKIWPVKPLPSKKHMNVKSPRYILHNSVHAWITNILWWISEHFSMILDIIPVISLRHSWLSAMALSGSQQCVVIFSPMVFIYFYRIFMVSWELDVIYLRTL